MRNRKRYEVKQLNKGMRCATDALHWMKSIRI